MRAPTAAEQSEKARALALWTEDRARLLMRQPFLALLAMQLDLVPVVDSRLDTACTDGARIFVSAAYLLGLAPEARVFLLGHEVWHCAGRHALRRGMRESRLWNIAADHEVNALLDEQGLKVPGDAILIRALRGKNAEQVYEALLQSGRAEEVQGQVVDQHLPLAGGAEAGVLDPDFAVHESARAWRGWEQRVLAAASQTERRRGALPSVVRRALAAQRGRTLPWPVLLRDFLLRTYHGSHRWTPPNRRYAAQGVYLPSRRGARLEIAVAIDSSGSTARSLGAFLAELRGILGAFGRYQVRLLVCDAAIRDDRVFHDHDGPLPNAVPLAGGGGTDFRPVFERLRGSPPQALVFLTDGRGPAPAQPPGYPVLWVLTRAGRPPAAWGTGIPLASATSSVAATPYARSTTATRAAAATEEIR